MKTTFSLLVILAITSCTSVDLENLRTQEVNPSPEINSSTDKLLPKGDSTISTTAKSLVDGASSSTDAVTVGNPSPSPQIDLDNLTDDQLQKILTKYNIPKTVTNTKIVTVEKPVYYPESQIGAQKAGSISGRPEDTTNQAQKTSIIQPRDYQGGFLSYDYQESFIYEIYCAMYRTTDIYLQPGELLFDDKSIKLGDPEKWVVDSGVSLEAGQKVQHIYIKPRLSDGSTNLTINTDRRVYHILLRAFPDTWMLAVKWRYFDQSLSLLTTQSTQAQNSGNPSPQQTLAQLSQSLRANSSNAQQPTSSPAPFSTELQQQSAINAASSSDQDPTLTMSFDYTMEFSVFKKPRWLPVRIYDDGRKTYIELPTSIGAGDFPIPAINDNEVVNFRVRGNFIIIDQLVTWLKLKLGNEIVTVHKKGT